MRVKNYIPHLLLLLVIGCKSGKNYEGSELNVPDKFYFEKENSLPKDSIINTDEISYEDASTFDFKELISDPVLDTLIQKALESNQNINIAAERVVQAQDGIIIQRSAMLPNFGVEGNASRGNFQGTLLPETQNLYYASAFASWELDFWGKFRRLNEAARARLVQSEEGLRATKLSLIGAVATNYFTLLDYKQRLEVSKRNLALRDSMVQLIEKRYEKGIVAEIDLNQAQILRAVAADAVPQWKRLISQTEHQISFLTGTNPDRIATQTELSTIDADINIPVGLPSQLLVRRPDLVAAEQNLKAQNALVGVSKANLLPNISLTGVLGTASNELSSFGDGSVIWNAGGNILAPLFNFGRLRRQVDIEESKMRQAFLVYEREVIDAFRSVEDALVEISTLKEQLSARKERLEASLNAQFLSGERYDKGVTSYLEYLESQRQAFEAELNYTETRANILRGYVKLYVSLGGGWKQ